LCQRKGREGEAAFDIDAETGCRDFADFRFGMAVDLAAARLCGVGRQARQAVTRLSIGFCRSQRLCG
jgi:hypothetical protein